MMQRWQQKRKEYCLWWMEEIVAQKRMSKYNEQHSDLKKREEMNYEMVSGKRILNVIFNHLKVYQ